MFIKTHIVTVSFALILAIAGSGCASQKAPTSPLDALKAYGEAFSKSDADGMKRLLSSGSVTMLEQEAAAQGVSLSEIILRETLFTRGQRSAEFRNIRTEDSTAKIDVKDSAGLWTTVYFTSENGSWKIDKQGFANELLRQSEEEKKKLDAMINGSQLTTDK